MSKSKKLSPEDKAINRIISVYKNRAKKKGVEFSLTRERFIELIQKPCFYDEVEKSNNCNGYPYNGIDRINPSIGYVEGNVVPCCKICNTAKNNMSENQYLAWTFKQSRFSKKRVVGTGTLGELDKNTLEVIDELTLGELDGSSKESS